MQCGLCCNGTIFADVELRDKRESGVMESLGLEVEDEGGRELLIQPCRALRGARCGIYASRPECCRTFECKVLKDFESGLIGFEEAIGFVRQLRELLAMKDQERVRTLIDRRFLDRPVV